MDNQIVAGRGAVELDGNQLTCDILVKLGRKDRAVAVSHSSWDAIDTSRNVVDQIINNGTPAYGITTGVGSQKDYHIAKQDIASFNDPLITAHATRVPGPTLPKHRVRAALVVILNQFTSGYSGVSEDLVRVILAGINTFEMPEIDASGSVGASDLVPLAQIAHWLFRTPMARELGLPQAKETLSLMNSNAVALAVGAETLVEAQRLMMIFDISAAVALEGFRGNLDAISEHVNAAHKRQGQGDVARRLRDFLTDSQLWSAGQARFLQDPLSFRCISQVHGAGHEVLQRAMAIWNEELNSVSDNPIIDASIAGVRSHGNMDSTRLTLAIDGLRQSLAKITDLAGERLNKQQWPAFSGLPTGLAEEASAFGGVQFLNLGHIAASLITSAKIWARPHLLTSVGQLADGVEDTASHALHAVHDLERLIDAGWKIAAVELAISVWAIHRRRLEPQNLGRGVRAVNDLILPLLPIGAEGTEVFDLGPLIETIRSEQLIEAVHSSLEQDNQAGTLKSISTACVDRLC